MPKIAESRDARTNSYAPEPPEVGKALDKLAIGKIMKRYKGLIDTPNARIAM